MVHEVQHLLDGDTALHFPSNNILSLRTSGAERLRVGSNGDIGIGTTSPTKKLHVVGDFQAHEVQAKRGLTVGSATNTMISFVSGISTVTNIGAANGLRSSEVLPVDGFDNVPASGGAGSDATFNVTLDTSGAATINVSYPGNGYSVGETLTIADSDIGNGGAPDLTFDVETLTVTNGIDTQRIHVANDVSVSGDLTVASGINIGTQPVLTSGQTQTNIDTAVANLVDSAPSTLNTLNELAAALGDDTNFSTTTATSLGNLSTATGLLSTATGVLQGVTGSFAQTGTDVDFSKLQIGSTPAYSQNRAIKLHDNGVQFGARVSLIGTNDNAGQGLEMVTDGSLSKRTIIRHEGEGSNDYGLSFFTTNGGTISEKVRFNGNGNVGIGTDSPSAPLHVVGSGIVTSDFVVDTNTLFVDASLNRVGINTSSPQASFHVDGDNIRLENAGEKSLEFDHQGYIYKVGDIDGGETQSHLEINSQAEYVRFLNPGAVGINGTPVGTTNKLQVFGPSLLSGNVNVTGGLTTLGKTTLSSDAFVIETGSFTLGATHKGATVLLQNSASINITVPAQVSGYVTTFIAETHNPVSFITGVGMSGLNSFNGASDIAGIYGQAQVIFKSSEYAFLGGNIV